MTTLVMLSVLVFGIMAYLRLPVSDLPNVDFPTISVTGQLPGANPTTMATAVATPLEREFSTISGLESMTSSSSMGRTQIILQFTLNRDIDAAAQDVQVAISRVLRQLPKDMPTPPTFRKVNPADQPILRIALTSPTLPLYTLNEYGDTLMAQRISMVSGVAQVQVYGAQKFAVRVQVDPQELAARGIGIDQVAEAVAKANVNLPTGTLHGTQQSLTVQASGQLTTAEPYNSVIVTYREGRPVRVGDIGTAYNSVENDKVAAWYVNQRSIILAVQRQPGTNTVEVAKGVKNLLPLMQAQLPASVSMHVLYDASTSIEESVQDVKFTLLFTLVLVVLVIFIFLRRLPYTVIPSTAMPMSLVGTFIVMYLMGYNVDNLSLMALILAVGFVVDDAIVMLENIVRHLEMGEGPVKAALNGSREIGFTIVSMTLSLVAVFIPILFMGGILGRIFQEFAVTIGAAILISGFGVAHADADALQPLFESACRPSPGAPLQRLRAGVRGDAVALPPQPGLVPRPPAHDDPHPGARHGRHGRAAASGAAGLHPERGPRDRIRPDRGGRGDLLRGHDSACSRRWPRSCARIRTWRRSCRTPARGRAGSPAGTRGRSFCASSPVTSASSRPTRSSRTCAPSSPRCRASGRSFRTRRPSPSAAG